MADPRGGLAAVSGASGFIGSAVVRRLLADGRRVRALLEPGARTDNLDDLPAGDLERVTVDVCDHAAMVRALAGCRAFYHLAAIYKVWTPDPRPIYRVNLEGTTASLMAAHRAGVERIVYTSSIAAVGLRGSGTPSDETVEWNLHDIANPYILTKYQSERIAMQLAAAGLPIVVVNPAFPFGPRDMAPTPTGKIVLELARGEVPAVGGGGFCAIDVDDVAAGHVAAESSGRVGERYVLGNHNVTFRQFAHVVCAVARVREPKLDVPNWASKGIVRGMELWSEHVSGREPKATVKSLQYLWRHAFFDVSKARRELGLPCTPLADSVERSVRFYRDRGML